MICTYCSLEVPILTQVVLALTTASIAIIIVLSINMLIELGGFKTKFRFRVRVVVRLTTVLLLSITFAINVYHSAMQVQDWDSAPS